MKIDALKRKARAGELQLATDPIIGMHCEIRYQTPSGKWKSKWTMVEPAGYKPRARKIEMEAHNGSI